VAHRLLGRAVVKPRLDEMRREAEERAARARDLRDRLRRATESVDGLIVETQSALRRAVEVLEQLGPPSSRPPSVRPKAEVEPAKR